VTVTKNEGRGFFVTGNTDWGDYAFSAKLSIHLADQAGLIVRYQGLERYIAVVKTRDTLRLVLRHYDDHVLDETPCHWQVDEPHVLRIEVKGRNITAWCDGRKILKGVDDKLGNGGAGFLFDTGTIRFGDIAMES